MVKISIVMPVYNCENHLNDTLNCIINQTFEDFELICINDGSTDNSLDILKNFACKDSRVQIISQENKGPGAARNKGLDVSSGDFLYFIDSDDYIVPNCLELLYNNITSNNSDIVFFKVGNIKRNKKVHIHEYFPFDKLFTDVDFNNFSFDYNSVRKYIFNASFAPWTKFYRKKFLDSYKDLRFDEELPYEDILFHVKIMLRSSRISFVPEYLYYYKIDNPHSVTFDSESHIEIFKIINYVEDFIRNENLFVEFKEEFEYFKNAQIMRHLSNPNDEKYYFIAKSEINSTDFKNNSLSPNSFKKSCQLFLDSANYNEYQKNLKILLLKEKKHKLKKENKKLKKRNKKLNKELDFQKNKKEKLLNSTSWKITTIFRKINR